MHFFFSTCSFFSHFIGFGLRPSGSFLDAFFFFDLQLLFPFYCLWFKAVGFRLQWIFCFSTCSFFSHFITISLRPSCSGFDRFFLFFDLQPLFCFFSLWFKAVGFSLWWIFLFFDLQLLFLFYCLWCKAVGFRLWFIFFLFFDLQLLFPILLALVKGRRVQALMDFLMFFDLQLLSPFYCLWFKAVGFRHWEIFFVFRFAASFFIFLPLI